MPYYKLNLFYQRKAILTNVEIDATFVPMIGLLKKLHKIAHRLSIFSGEEYFHSFRNFKVVLIPESHILLGHINYIFDSTALNEDARDPLFDVIGNDPNLKFHVCDGGGYSSLFIYNLDQYLI